SAAGDVAGHGGRGGPPRGGGGQAAGGRRTGVEAVRPPAPATGVARVAARREPPGAEVPTSIRAEECPVMMLYVVRHAIAEDAPEGGDDAARRLTPDGRRKKAEGARGPRARSGWRPTSCRRARSSGRWRRRGSWWQGFATPPSLASSRASHGMSPPPTR